MTDPMTEGAKTETGTGKAYTIPQIRRCLEGWLSANGDNTSGTAAIHNFLLCLECDQDGIEADTKRMESRDLTEALKVAGDALDAAEEWLSEERGSNGILGTIAEAREKLERIRNNKH